MKTELDTGSDVSVVYQRDCNAHFRRSALKTTSITLKTCSCEKVVPFRVIDLNFEHENQKAMLELYVVEKEGFWTGMVY